jgi:predicted Zn-dependent protease
MKFRYLIRACLVITCALILSNCGVRSRTASNLIKADNYYYSHQYAIAGNMYYQLTRNDKISKIAKQDIAFKAAECARLNHNVNRALKMYRYAIRLGNKDHITNFRMAEMLMATAQYSEALIAFKEYKKGNPDDPDVNLKIAGCELALNGPE